MNISDAFWFQFIDGRLAKLNAGRGFSDVFEEEITSGGFSGGKPIPVWPSVFRMPINLISAPASAVSCSINSFFLLNVQCLRYIFSPSESYGINLRCLISVVQGVRGSPELVVVRLDAFLLLLLDINITEMRLVSIFLPLVRINILC